MKPSKANCDLRIFLSFLSLLITFLYFGCNGAGSDSVKNAKDSNAAKIDSQTATGGTARSSQALSKADADFLVDAASGAMMEVQLGRLAQTHATNPRVKDFGAMMVKDHGEGMEKLKRLAARKHVVLPDSVSTHQQKEINDLRKRKDGNFDKTYVQLMIADHRSDIHEFEKEAGQAMDSSTRLFAGSSLQMLRRHLDSANNLTHLVGLNNIKVTPYPY